jgi:hypothetical protein
MTQRDGPAAREGKFEPAQRGRRLEKFLKQLLPQLFRIAGRRPDLHQRAVNIKYDCADFHVAVAHKSG